jgi:hypothetical protein
MEPLQLLPFGFGLIDNRKLRHLHRRVIKRAETLDREYFRENPLRLTRVRLALDGETGGIAFPGRRAFVIVRQVRPGAHHKYLAFSLMNLAELASSEDAATRLYQQLMEGWQHDPKLTQQEVNEMLAAALAAAPVQGRA